MDIFATSSTLEMRCKHFFSINPMGGETEPMGGETRNFWEKFGSQGITALYPYSRYNGASTNEVDLYIVHSLLLSPTVLIPCLKLL